jgi:hypothetical protein
MSVPIHDFAIANENETLETIDTESYYSCCGKSTCGGCDTPSVSLVTL